LMHLSPPRKAFATRAARGFFLDKPSSSLRTERSDGATACRHGGVEVSDPYKYIDEMHGDLSDSSDASEIETTESSGEDSEGSEYSEEEARAAPLRRGRGRPKNPQAHAARALLAREDKKTRGPDKRTKWSDEDRARTVPRVPRASVADEKQESEGGGGGEV